MHYIIRTNWFFNIILYANLYMYNIIEEPWFQSSEKILLRVRSRNLIAETTLKTQDFGKRTLFFFFFYEYATGGNQRPPWRMPFTTV